MTWIPKNRIWPTIITSVLVGNLVLGIVLVRIAVGDDHFAVEPDYYQRALAWDTVQAQAASNLRLGWHLSATMPPLQASGATVLTLHLVDRDGAPIRADRAVIEARPIAHASELVRGDARAGSEPGILQATMPFDREGLWELRVRVARADDQYTATLRLDLSRHRTALLIRDRPGDADSATTSLGTRPR